MLPEKLRHGGRVFADPCGCEWQGQRWLKLCATHAAEVAEVHRRAMADYRAGLVSSNDGQAGTGPVGAASPDSVDERVPEHAG